MKRAHVAVLTLAVARTIPAGLTPARVAPPAAAVLATPPAPPSTLSPAAAIRPAPATPASNAIANYPAKKPGTIRIALAGDSTVTNDAGWAVGFNDMLTDNVECINLSRGGRSSGSFVQEGRWKETLALKPDYVLIQFGHNDQPGHAERTTDPDTTFRTNIMQYITDARAAGVNPVLVTPLTRRQWGSDDRIHSTLAPYAVAVRRIAVEMKVPLIDLQEKSLEFYESMGRVGMEGLSPVRAGPPAAPIFDGTFGFDGTHLNAEGSAAIGAMVATDLRRAVPELAGSIHADRRFIVVSPDASGDFRTMHEAIAAIPDNSALRTFVHLRPGVYDEGQIVLPETKKNVTFEGEDVNHTTMRYHYVETEPQPPVLAGNPGTGVLILAEGFHASKLWFENAAGNHGQGMALRMDADKIVMNNCRITGWQDTIQINKGRQYFKECFISGRVDFIYGGATAVFDHCEIQHRSSGHMTAAGTPQDQPFGFVFMNCKLTYDPVTWVNPMNPDDPNSKKSYEPDLGRPWRDYATVALINCDIETPINPAGFVTWSSAPQRNNTVRYSEYGSTGPGGDMSKRASWMHKLTDEEAKAYTISNILGEDHWDPNAAD